MNPTQKKLLIIFLSLFGLSVISFIIWWNSQNLRWLGVAFLCMVGAISAGLISNWKYIGKASVTIRAGGGSPVRTNNKGGMMPSSPDYNSGEIVHKNTYKKGEEGYLGIFIIFGGTLFIFFVVGIALIVWGGG